MSIFSLLNNIESNFQHLNFDLEDYATTYNPSTVTITFNANTVGDHYVGYSYLGDVNIQPVVDFNTPYVYDVITINVTSVGPQTATIPVKGSLYCANLIYFGYIIAACQNQTDGTGNNIPDEAITWSEALPKQADPVALTEITCIAAPLGTPTVNMTGVAGCVDGTYPLSFIESSPGDELIPAVGNLVISNGGTTVSAQISNSGLYKAIPLISVTGSACTPNPTIEMYTLDKSSITLSDYIPASGSIYEPVENSIYLLSVGDTVQMFTDQTITLPAAFESAVLANGHCTGCENLTIDSTAATTGSGKVTFNLPWSGINAPLQLKTIPIQPGVSTNVGCITIGTATYDFGTLDVTPTTTTGAC